MINKRDVKQSRLLAIHKRFYAALVLLDLVNEMPLPEVCRKYKTSRGVVQSLQQSAATFAGKSPWFVAVMENHEI